MSARRSVAALALVAATTASACSSLLSADPTPVPGAAATLTRSLRTPIPTTTAAGPSPAVSPVASRIAASPVASPQAVGSVTDAEIAQVQRRMEQVLGSASLPGIDGLLLDHVSLSTTQGGAVLDSAQAASWLRDHAAASVKVGSVDAGTQSLMLLVESTGWPNQDSVQQGKLTFSLRKYDPSGRPDDESGDWKIDVIDVQ